MTEGPIRFLNKFLWLQHLRRFLARLYAVSQGKLRGLNFFHIQNQSFQQKFKSTCYEIHFTIEQHKILITASRKYVRTELILLAVPSLEGKVQHRMIYGIIMQVM